MDQGNKQGDQYIRKQYIVDKQMQTYHLRVWLGSSVITIAAIACCFYFFKIRPTEAKDPVITHNLYVVLLGSAAFIILYSILMGLHALLHSHRIAGAEYNLKKSINKLMAKDYAHRVVLRKNDYLKGVAESFNTMAGKLGEDQASLLKKIDELEKVGKLPDEAKELVKAIHNMVSTSTVKLEEDGAAVVIKNSSVDISDEETEDIKMPAEEKKKDDGKDEEKKD